MTAGDPFALAFEGVAIVDAVAGTSTYAELRSARDAFVERSAGGHSRKQLGLVLCDRSAAALTAYLGGVHGENAVALLEAKLDPGLLDAFARAYEPDWISAPAGTLGLDGYERKDDGAPVLWSRRAPSQSTIHPDLAVLLSTSGTTGSRKVVRLSRRNVMENARSIAEYLGLAPGERALQILPLSYSFGLSVVNSHLASGGALLVSEHAVATRDLWRFADANGATSLAAVPYTYQTLARLDLDKLAPPSLATLTQAGGRLDPALGRRFAEWAARREGRRFFVMYGQTEATARMSYVPSERAIDKHDTIGVPIPEGAMHLDTATHELIYTGPNVMMGYATTRADLARGDDLGGVLATGDIGALDSDGFFRVVGRRARFVKVFGLRVALDEVEAIATQESNALVAAIGEDDRITLVVLDDAVGARARDAVSARLRIHASAIGVRRVGAIPRTAKGSIDYRALAEAAK